MKRLIASFFVMMSVSAAAQVYTPATVLATYPHQELMDTQQMNCTEYYETVPSHGHMGVPGAIIGGVIGSRFGGGDGRTASIVIGSMLGYHHPTHRPVTVHRQNCYPMNVRTMVTVGYKVTVRLPNGQNTLVHTRHEPPIGSVLYLPY